VVSSQNLHINNIIQTQQVIFTLYIHVTSINEKTHEFEREQKDVYGRIGGEKVKGEII